MFKSIVNELTSSETLDVKVRSNEGDEILLKIKPEEKFVNVKQEIWKNIGFKTQMKIGDAIIDIMTGWRRSNCHFKSAFKKWKGWPYRKKT